MENVENTTKELDFSEGFEALSAKKQKKIRTEIMEKCEWSNGTFYNKLRGLNRIKWPESRIIEEIFKQYAIDAWTGQNIN